jgi:drug/metabolite transporter (DMT)-like permease
LSFALIRRAGISPWGHAHGLLITRGLLGFLGLSCVFYSVTHLPLAEATVIQYLHPTFTALLAAALLRESMDGRVVAASAISLCGVLLVARPSFLPAPIGLSGEAALSFEPLALAAALGGAFFSAAAYVVVRHLSRREDALVIVLYFPLVTVPATLPTLWSGAIWPQGITWLWLLGIGIATQIGQVLLTRGLEILPAARGTALSYSQVLFATIWGLVFFAETPSRWTVAGALLITGGTLLVALRGSGPSAPSENLSRERDEDLGRR